MHICFSAIDFHSRSDGGGIASYTHVLSQALLKRGWKVSVVAKGKCLKLIHTDGIDVLEYPFGNLSWYIYRLGLFRRWLTHPIRELEWSRSVYRAIQELVEPPDVIEGCETGNLFLKRLGIPFVIRLHGEAYTFMKHTDQPIHLGLRLARQLEFRSLRAANAVTSPSAYQAREVAAALKWQPDRIHVIPNPVADWLVTRGEVARVPRHTASPIVLYTGRMEYRKGILVLLKSVPYVAHKLPEVRFSIVGRLHNSVSPETINRVLEASRCAANVELVGHVAWQNIAPWYERATLFVMPSFYETFGISCVEAMCFGLPVVATRVGGLPEVVEDGVTGILVPPNDPQSLAEAILMLLRDPAKCKRMGEQGRQKALSQFTSERVAEQSTTLYRQVMSDA